MGGAAVLVVQVVGVLPYVEGEDGGEAAGQGVAGAGLLGDGQCAVRGGGKPYPAAAEQACAFGFEVCLEGVQGAPLKEDLVQEMPGGSGQDGIPDQVGDDGRVGGDGWTELSEVEVVVQDLAGIVEDWAGRSSTYNLLQRLPFESAAGQQLVKVVDIGLKVLSVVERDGSGADHRLQCISSVREFN